MFTFHLWNFIRPLKWIYIEFLTLPFLETTLKFVFLLLSRLYLETLGVSIE